MFLNEKSEYSNIYHKNRFVLDAYPAPLYEDPDWGAVESGEESDSEVGVDLPAASIRQVAAMYQHEEDEDAKLLRMTLLG